MVTKGKSSNNSQSRTKPSTDGNRRAKIMKEHVSSTMSTTKTRSIQPAGTMTTQKSPLPSSKEKLLIELIPLFNEYQIYCVSNDFSTSDAEGNVNDMDHNIPDSNYQKVQLRNRLVGKLITLCNTHELTSKISNLSIVHENEDTSGDDVKITTNTSREQSVISDCFVHIMNSAIASLINSKPSATSKSIANFSSIASTAILELLVTAVVSWMMAKHQPNKDIAIYSAIVELILSHLCQYSKCQDDTVRIVTLRSLCYMAEIVEPCVECEDDELTEKSLQWLDSIQQAILPRFTDKAIAVRCAVVQACFSSYKVKRNPLSADPDILQAVQWVAQHDPSPNNRMVAIQYIPINRATMEYVVPRIRDTKVNVRLAVVKALSKAVDQQFQEQDGDTASDERIQFLIPSRHISELLTAGYTDRCIATKEAVRQMVCTSWIKAAKYNPVTLLQWVNVMDYTKAATAILQIWCDVSNTSPSWFVEDLSEYEQQNFRAGLQDAVNNFTITDVVSVEKKHVTENLFIVSNLLRYMTSDFEKDLLWSRIVPDIPLLCKVLEDLTTQLVQLFASEDAVDRGNSERQEELIFLCTELFQLTWLNVKSMEEGSRRILISTINNLLSNVVTPDDLLEGCVTTLNNIYDSDDSQEHSGIESEIVSVIRHISDSINSSDNELLAVHASVRIISLIISVLESRDFISADAMECFVSYTHPAMSHENRFLRQASVRAWGLLGLLMTPALENEFSNDNYTSALQEIACNDIEDIEIRIQAMFALTDWVMLQFRNGKSISNNEVMDSLCMQIDQLFQVPIHYGQGSICCAAEIATKLILCFLMDPTILNDTTYKERIPIWMARLAMMYFEYENAANDSDNDPEGSNEVGHPVRLQQLLSVFFSMTTTSAFSSLNSYVLDSIKPLLNMFMRQQQDKKQKYNKMSSTSTTALLWTRTLDFIVSLATKSRDIKAEQSTEPSPSTPSHEKNDNNTDTPTCIEKGDFQPVDEDTSTSDPTVPIESSPDLVGSLQVASFMAEEGSMINVTIRKVLCKWIVRQTSYLDIEKELWEDLSRFKATLEELVDNDGIDDASCRRLLEPILHMLMDVESDNDDTDDEAVEDDDDEVVESLSSAIGKVAIVPDGNENSRSTIRSTSNITKNINDSVQSSGKNGSGRLQRRLRPSN